MKPIFLVALLCMSAGNSRCQIHTWQLSLTDSSRNILYIGVENRIRVAQVPKGAGVRFQKGTVSTGSGYDRPDEFYVRVTIPGPDTLYVIKNGKRIYSKAFQVLLQKDLKIRLGTVQGNSVTVYRIIADPELQVYVDSSYLRLHVGVISFDVSYKSRQQNLISAVVNGSRLYDQELDKVRQLRPGDQIIFDEIRVVGPGGKVRNMGSLTYIIR